MTTMGGERQTTSSRQSSFIQNGTISEKPYDKRFHVCGDQVARATGTSSVASEELYYQGMQIVGEHVVEHEITVPTRKIVEEVVEKVIVVPEKIQREEITEEKKIVRERIVQVAQPVDKIVYVDEVVYEDREVVVEVPKV